MNEHVRYIDTHSEHKESYVKGCRECRLEFDADGPKSCVGTVVEILQVTPDWAYLTLRLAFTGECVHVDVDMRQTPQCITRGCSYRLCGARTGKYIVSITRFVRDADDEMSR